ncbi:alpha/beta fold hydrolase [Chitinasiproducens palmae]|uniref:Pimeloyl-ACP methyl ester carboxylesterase n=1 Tax=Chitinasiproducens palmae TaxID=1770053 RepID=A0A1H2PLA9_9BURK|nr:alpha/beta hydrolase [Chitinasiproducens palmae]SDV46767.1 Pimeloyl-ACP methyl ester carboxylesterase [Chitinasiproducens palmae]
MTQVKTGVLEVEVACAGPDDGTPVLLLHGWPDAPRGWSAIAARLHAAGYRTIVPTLRGTGGTRFLSSATVRDGSAVALTQDAIDVLDALGVARVDVVGHDWGGRAAFTLAALHSDRIRRIVSLSVAFQPYGRFVIPATFTQSRHYWYQWFMSLDGGPQAIAADPIGFARSQWDGWSPPGWFDEAEFSATAAAFRNPDWLPITLNAYRRRWRNDEASDPRYAAATERLAQIGQIDVPTLVVQGASDTCTEPATTSGQEACFTAGYTRLVLDGVGHFPAREAPQQVADAVIAYFRAR